MAKKPITKVRDINNPDTYQFLLDTYRLVWVHTSSATMKEGFPEWYAQFSALPIEDQQELIEMTARNNKEMK